jgi:primosomal protein N'
VTRYASVYPLVTARVLAREFTYEIADDIAPGAVVEVRFGNAKRRGVVTKVDVEPPKGIDTSAVERVVEVLPRPLFELALWVADYYGSTPGRALTLVAPVQRKARGERPQPAERDSLPGEAEPAELSTAQRAAVDRIVGALDAGQSANFLLYGATGSGKTEVYLQACAVALERGLGAIVLVPEIALTPQALGRFRARFGERIAVLHSSLTEAERRDERTFGRVRTGAAARVDLRRRGARRLVQAGVRSTLRRAYGRRETRCARRRGRGVRKRDTAPGKLGHARAARPGRTAVGSATACAHRRSPPRSRLSAVGAASRRARCDRRARR